MWWRWPVVVGRACRWRGIADDFVVREATMRKWLRAADVEEGNLAGLTAVDRAELRELRKRTRLLEQENEVCDARPRICLRRT